MRSPASSDARWRRSAITSGALDGRFAPIDARRIEDQAQAAQALALYGLTPREIARELECSTDQARSLLSEARRRGLHRGPPNHHRDGVGLVAWFPPGPFTPGMVCQHGPFPDDSPFICMGCNACAWDWHPKFHAEPLPPEPAAKLVEHQADGLDGGSGRQKKWSDQQRADTKALVQASLRLPRKERRRLAWAAREAERCRAVLAKAG